MKLIGKISKRKICSKADNSRIARGIFSAILAVKLILCLPGLADACPTCKNDLHHSGMELGFAISILFMIAVPFCLFAAWTIAILRMTRTTAEEELSPPEAN